MENGAKIIKVNGKRTLVFVEAVAPKYTIKRYIGARTGFISGKPTPHYNGTCDASYSFKDYYR